MNQAATVVFYYRNGCHLCEELAAILFRGWPQIAETIEWRDVDSRSDWSERYGLQVPVLTQAERTICSLRPDPDRLREYFGESENPV